MRREQGPGDWAAWMSGGAAPAADGPAAVAPAPAPGPPIANPAPVAAPPTAGPRAAGPARGPAPEPDGEPHRSPRREATRQRVLDAAREVFAENGVIGATVEDICERAGFTRGAFYSNFADKDEVTDALVEREQTRLLELLDSRFGEIEHEVAAAFDLPAVLRAIVDRILVAVPLDRELSLVNAELENLAIRRPEAGASYLAINTRFRQHIAAFIAAAMERNGRELLIDAGILTEAIIGVTQRSVRRALLDGGDTDPNEVASQVLPGLILAFSRPRGGSTIP